MGWIFCFAFLILAAFSPSARNNDILKAGYCITAGLFGICGGITFLWSKFMDVVKAFVKYIKEEVNEYQNNTNQNGTESKEI